MQLKNDAIQIAIDMFWDFAQHMLSSGIAINLEDLREITNEMIDHLHEEDFA